VTVLPFNVRFEAAARFFAAKVPLPRAEFDRLADWAKIRAFTAAKVTAARALQGVIDAVQDAIDEGLTFGDFYELLDDVLDVNVSRSYAELVLRNNTQSAYGSGRWDEQRAQRDDFPYLLLDEVDDERTRVGHAAQDGTVKPIGDPYWRTHYPPWGHNCRGHAASLTEGEAREIGISPTNILDASENEEGFTSPGASDMYNPDVSTLEPTIRACVRRALRDFNPNAVAD
jgi:SPP1 gp7 family putative phage head morphogenesis protein